MAKFQDEKCFRLLDLPSKLRAHIYKFVVIEDTPIKTQFSYRLEREKGVLHHVSLPPQPALASTCKFVQEEVLPIFYAENHFHLGSKPLNGLKWLVEGWQGFLRDNSKHLRHVSLGMYVSLGLGSKIFNIDPTLLANGAIGGRRRLNGEDFCVCDFGEMSEELQGQKDDGQRVLDFVEGLFDKQGGRQTIFNLRRMWIGEARRGW